MQIFFPEIYSYLKQNKIKPSFICKNSVASRFWSYRERERFPLTFSPVVSDSRVRCSSPFPSHRASVCPKTVSVVMWPEQLDMEHHYLLTEVVPIYLLTFLHAFELLGWQEPLL